MAAPRIPNHWIDDPIGALVLQRFWEFALLGSSASSAELSYRAELEALPKEELSKRVSEGRKLEHGFEQIRLEHIENQKFFHQPNSTMDVHHWSKMSYWTIDEAVALSLGKDPRVVSWPRVQSELSNSPFAKLFANRRDIFMRWKVAGQLYDFTIPGVFLAWASRMQVLVPAELIAAVEALGIPIRDWNVEFDELRAIAEIATTSEMEARAEAQNLRGRIAELESAPNQPAAAVSSAEKSLGARERHSLLKLVIGMALGGYAYNPKLGRTETAHEIACDLEKFGIPLDEDTVRKYLNEAKALLLPSETE